jgi:hypothetical protein
MTIEARFCEIYAVARRHSMHWKWRHRGADGLINECAEEFYRYLDCLAAARASGYEPRSKWTAPLGFAALLG